MISAQRNIPADAGAAPAGGTDETTYLVDDDMGESGLQWQVSHLLASLLQFYFEYLRRPMLVAGNQYIYYQQGNPRAGLSPDVYVIPDESTPVDEVKSWKLWEHGGKGPSLAVEIVAEDGDEARKDYDEETLRKYEAMGVQELFRYDPCCGSPPRRLGAGRRRLLTHFVRDAEGKLQEQPLAHPERARSTLYDFWLVHQPSRRLRIGLGPDGLLLWPTRAEAESRRAEEESRRAEEESRRAEEESRRAEEESRRAEEESRRAEEESRRAEEAQQQLAAASQREAALLAELERLRAERG